MARTRVSPRTLIYAYKRAGGAGYKNVGELMRFGELRLKELQQAFELFLQNQKELRTMLYTAIDGATDRFYLVDTVRPSRHPGDHIGSLCLIPVEAWRQTVLYNPEYDLWKDELPAEKLVLGEPRPKKLILGEADWDQIVLHFNDPENPEGAVGTVILDRSMYGIRVLLPEFDHGGADLLVDLMHGEAGEKKGGIKVWNEATQGDNPLWEYAWTHTPGEGVEP